MNNFIVLDSIYGKFIVNRFQEKHSEYLVKTFATHIEDELAIIKPIIDSLEKDCIIVDVGANIGFVTVPIAQWIKHKNGKVIAIEPQRMLFNALSGTIVLNDLDNVFLHNIGLSNDDELSIIPEVNYSSYSDFGLVQICERKIIVEENELMYNRNVVTKPLDYFNLQRLDFLKIDVEGYELRVLNGAVDTISKCRPYIWIEYHLVTKEKIIEIIEKFGDYEFHVVDVLNMICIPKERMNTNVN